MNGTGNTNGRYQIVAGGAGGFMLIDTQTGRSWRRGSADDWVPIPFKGDAPAAAPK